MREGPNDPVADQIHAGLSRRDRMAATRTWTGAVFFPRRSRPCPVVRNWPPCRVSTPRRWYGRCGTRSQPSHQNHDTMKWRTVLLLGGIGAAPGGDRVTTLAWRPDPGRARKRVSTRAPICRNRAGRFIFKAGRTSASRKAPPASGVRLQPECRRNRRHLRRKGGRRSATAHRRRRDAARKISGQFPRRPRHAVRPVRPHAEGRRRKRPNSSD